MLVSAKVKSRLGRRRETFGDGNQSGNQSGNIGRGHKDEHAKENADKQRQRHQPKNDMVVTVQIPFYNISISIDTLLQAIYALTAGLSLFMVIWILIGPASWRLGLADDYLPLSGFHRRSLEQYFEQNYAQAAAMGRLGVVPRSLLFKYEGHPVIQLSHTLAGAVWAGMVPFQLHPTFRRRHPM